MEIYFLVENITTPSDTKECDTLEDARNTKRKWQLLHPLDIIRIYQVTKIYKSIT